MRKRKVESEFYIYKILAAIFGIRISIGPVFKKCLHKDCSMFGSILLQTKCLSSQMSSPPDPNSPHPTEISKGPKDVAFHLMLDKDHWFFFFLSLAPIWFYFLCHLWQRFPFVQSCPTLGDGAELRFLVKGASIFQSFSMVVWPAWLYTKGTQNAVTFQPKWYLLIYSHLHAFELYR